MQTKDLIEKIKTQTGVPYIDVVCYKKHECVYRYFSGKNINGKEQLYMYSLSKVLTATATMQLVEKRLINLDDKVCRFLPEIKDAFVLDNGKEKVVGDKMSIRHLLTMTAGFDYDLRTPFIEELNRQSNGTAKLRDFISAFVKKPLSFKPGEKFQYSICHDVLAGVIEVVSGTDFASYVKREIFDKLGMNNSYFDNREQGVLECYVSDVDGNVLKMEDQSKSLMPSKAYQSGGAGLSSTVEDYILFADALACGGVGYNGQRILKEESIKLLASEQVGSITVENNFTCVQGEDYGYGLGVRVRIKDTEWGLKKGEFGWDGAAGSFVLIDPENEVSVFVGLHVRNWPIIFTHKHIEIVEQLYKEIF